MLERCEIGGLCKVPTLMKRFKKDKTFISTREMVKRTTQTIPRGDNIQSLNLLRLINNELKKSRYMYRIWVPSERCSVVSSFGLRPGNYSGSVLGVSPNSPETPQSSWFGPSGSGQSNSQWAGMPECVA